MQNSFKNVRDDLSATSHSYINDCIFLCISIQFLISLVSTQQTYLIL